MKTFTVKTILSSLTLGVLLLGTLPAAYAGGPSKKIVFGDLDLAKQEDAAVLYQRIKRAAHDVCRREMSQTTSWDGSAMTHKNRCVKLIIDDAVTRVNQPTLTAIHGEKTVEVAGR